MENEKIDEIKRKFDEFLDEFVSSGQLRKIIEKSLNENPPVFKIKGKGEERAEEVIKRIESSNLTELIQEYLKAVEEVKRNRKLPPEDKLKKLIPPLHEIQRIFFPNYPKYYDVSGLVDIIPFADDGYIDLRKELSLEDLIPNYDKYSICDTVFDKTGLLDTQRRNISLSEKYEWYLVYCRKVKPISEPDFERIYDKEIAPEIKPAKNSPQLDSILENKLYPPLLHKSISEIWPGWLPTLNQKSIKSNDLLTQILVCYTIKRALNGDEKASKKLYELYVGVAQAIAIKIGMKFHVPREIKDIKQDAAILLRLLIGGFRPDYILEQLVKDESERTIMVFPKWVKGFYIYYLLEYVPERLRETLTRLKEIGRLIKFVDDFSSGAISTMDLIKQDEAAKEVIEKLQSSNIEDAVELLRGRIGVLGLEVVTLLNPYAPIQDGTVWKGTPKRLNRFNSYSFRPGQVKMGPKNNLTIWLLGTPAKPQYGKLYQLLRDKYKPVAVKRRKEESLESMIDEDREESFYSEDRKKALGMGEKDIKKYQDKSVNEIIQKEEIERLKKELIDLGASARNVEIYFRWKGDDKPTQSEIAKEYGLSMRQVGRICQQLKRLLPKVKHLFLEE